MERVGVPATQSGEVGGKLVVIHRLVILVEGNDEMHLMPSREYPHVLLELGGERHGPSPGWILHDDLHGMSRFLAAMAIHLRRNDSLDDRVLTRQGNGAAPLCRQTRGGSCVLARTPFCRRPRCERPA